MEKVLSCSRPKLRDHFEAFLHGQKVDCKEIRRGEQFASRADLSGSLSGQEVRIKTENSACEEAALNHGFFRVPIKTEKPDDETRTDSELYDDGSIAVRPVRIKTEKFDVDEVAVSGLPTTSAPLIPDAIVVKKEKEDTIHIKTEKEENHNKSTNLGDKKVVNSSGGACATPIKIEEDHSDCHVKEEADDSSHEYDEGGSCDAADSSIHSPDPPDNSNVEGKELRRGTDEHEKQDCSKNPIESRRNLSLTGDTSLGHGGSAAESNDPEHTHNQSRERKAKKLAKMMLKELQENMDFVDIVDGKRVGSFQRSKHFFSLSAQSSVPRRLQDLNNDFNKYKGMFSLQECSVKVRRLSEEVLVRYGVKLGDIAEKKIDIETLKKGLFSCSQCLFRTDRIIVLGQHLKLKHANRQYHQCPRCDFRANWKCGVTEHIKRFHENQKPLQCPDCNYRCGTTQTLELHKFTHSGDKPFKCPYCEYRAAHNGSIKSHVYTHTGEKPYACPHCSYRCTQYPHLKSHLYVHTNTKPYACKLCNFKATQSTHLKTHMRLIHCDDRPHKCDICKLSFKDRHTLKLHRRRHTGEKPYACKFCPFRSAQTNTLRCHILCHENRNTFNCKTCSYSSKKNVHLQKHIITCHT